MGAVAQAASQVSDINRYEAAVASVRSAAIDSNTTMHHE